MLRDPDRKDHSSHIYEKRTHTQQHIRKIPAYEIPHNTKKIGCLGIAEKISSWHNGIKPQVSTDKR